MCLGILEVFGRLAYATLPLSKKTLRGRMLQRMVNATAVALGQTTSVFELMGSLMGLQVKRLYCTAISEASGGEGARHFGGASRCIPFHNAMKLQ